MTTHSPFPMTIGAQVLFESMTGRRLTSRPYRCDDARVEAFQVEGLDAGYRYELAALERYCLTAKALGVTELFIDADGIVFARVAARRYEIRYDTGLAVDVT